jgi:hypothetical protein
MHDTGGGGRQPGHLLEAATVWWRNLPSVSCEEEFLELPDGSFFMGKMEKGSKMLIRKSCEL